MTPRSQRMERVSMATAGVGMGPSNSTSIPTEVKPGHERSFDHVAGEPRVLADDDPMAVIAALKREAGRLADPQGEIGRDDAVGPAANAIRSEVFPHVVLSAFDSDAPEHDVFEKPTAKFPHHPASATKVSKQPARSGSRLGTSICSSGRAS